MPTVTGNSAPRNGLLTKAEAREELRLSDKTFDRMIAAGRIEAYRIGPRSIRIPAAAVDALLAESRVTPRHDSTPVGAGAGSKIADAGGERASG